MKSMRLDLLIVVSLTAWYWLMRCEFVVMAPYWEP